MAILTSLQARTANSQTPNISFLGLSGVGSGPFAPIAVLLDATGTPISSSNPLRVNVSSLPSLPAGANLIGSVNVPSLPSLPAGANTIGSVNVSSLPSLPAGANMIGSVNVANFPSSQSVSDVQNAPFSGAVAMTAGTVYAAQRSLGVLCTSSGNVQMQLSDSSSLTLPVAPGWQTFPFAVVQIVAAGTTATASFYNLK